MSRIKARQAIANLHASMDGIGLLEAAEDFERQWPGWEAEYYLGMASELRENHDVALFWYRKSEASYRQAKGSSHPKLAGAVTRVADKLTKPAQVGHSVIEAQARDDASSRPDPPRPPNQRNPGTGSQTRQARSGDRRARDRGESDPRPGGFGSFSAYAPKRPRGMYREPLGSVPVSADRLEWTSAPSADLVPLEAEIRARRPRLAPGESEVVTFMLGGVRVTANWSRYSDGGHYTLVSIEPPA